MKSTVILVAAWAALMLPSLAADDGDRTKLAGSWQESAGDPGKTWTIAEMGDRMQITETVKGEKLVEFQCNTVGKECSAKHGKVSMWFNGPKLVVMETRGSDVVKRRFEASADGGALELEVIPIAPSGKTEKVALKRVTSTNVQ
jgi:hypothetical protein